MVLLEEAVQILFGFLVSVHSWQVASLQLDALVLVLGLLAALLAPEHSIATLDIRRARLAVKHTLRDVNQTLLALATQHICLV